MWIGILDQDEQRRQGASRRGSLASRRRRDRGGQGQFDVEAPAPGQIRDQSEFTSATADQAAAGGQSENILGRTVFSLQEVASVALVRRPRPPDAHLASRGQAGDAQGNDLVRLAGHRIPGVPQQRGEDTFQIAGPGGYNDRLLSQQIQRPARRFVTFGFTHSCQTAEQRDQVGRAALPLPALQEVQQRGDIRDPLLGLAGNPGQFGLDPSSPAMTQQPLGARLNLGQPPLQLSGGIGNDPASGLGLIPSRRPFPQSFLFPKPHAYRSLIGEVLRGGLLGLVEDADSRGVADFQDSHQVVLGQHRREQDGAGGCARAVTERAAAGVRNRDDTSISEAQGHGLFAKPDGIVHQDGHRGRSGDRAVLNAAKCTGGMVH